MPKIGSILQNTCFLIIFTFCIDQGDGRWREKDRENFEHDFELYKTMAEKIEREIEAYHDEYPEEGPGGDTIDTTHYKLVTNTFKRNSEANIFNKPDGGKQNFTYNVSNKTKNVEATQNKGHLNISNYEINSNLSKQNLKWPKFEEILLEIGKKYDWKNDRWIKAKQKISRSKTIRITDKTKISDYNTKKNHELHKFNYKIVKLNRSKNRRSVVVAVTAVR